MKIKGKFQYLSLACGIVATLLTNTARAEDVTLQVGYIPILPMSQLFVMEGEGWTKDAGIKLDKTRFSDGPSIVQALASGKLDVVYMGIGPALVAKANGIDIKVVASNVVEQIAMVARGDLAEYMDGADPKAAIQKFTKDHGRKPKIATLPKGSVPDTVFRHWLIKVAGLTEDDVEIVGMGASRVQQALLAGSVDGASILEPTVTLVLDRLPSAKVVVYGGDMMPNQPGAVVVVRSDLLKSDPQIVRKLVALHKRATDMLLNDPQRAAAHIHEAIGRGLIPIAMIQKAVTSPYSKFQSDPHSIVESTKLLHDFQAEIGTLRKPVPLAELFDMAVYDEAK